MSTIILCNRLLKNIGDDCFASLTAYCSHRTISNLLKERPKSLEVSFHARHFGTEEKLNLVNFLVLGYTDN